MATAPLTHRNAPAIVVSKLAQLRRKLTGWILVHGLGRWLMVLLVILAVDILLDRVFRMDFSQRLILLAAMAGSTGFYFFWRVLRPLSKRPNDDSLIYEVEQKNPELRENLISSWQLSGQQDLEAMGISAELASATINSGISKAEQINFNAALDLPHHRQNWGILLIGVLFAGLLGYGVIQTEFLRTWFNRNILLTNDQWPQSTYLEIAGAKDGKLVLPRGADYRQFVVVSDDSTIQDVAVSLEIDNSTARTIHAMKPTGKLDGREHSHLFHNVSSIFRFRAKGGDAVTQWVDVELVEPPAVINLELVELLPAYTGTPSVPLTGNGPHSILAGSRLQISALVNKPLQGIFLKIDDQQFDLNQVDDSKNYSITLNPADLRGGEYQFELVDQTGLASIRPSKFLLTLKEDQPPKARASLLGISGLVVPRAMIPVAYQFSDNYGLQRLYFDCHWKTGSEGKEKSFDPQLEFAKFSTPSQTLETDAQNRENNSQPAIEPVRDVKDVAVLDLKPLKLPPGISFRFSVAATDTKPGSPSVGKSQEFLLRVVTDEELRADLLRREIEQRKAFEQAYEKQMQLATDLLAISSREVPSGADAEAFKTQRESDLIALVREQKGIGTSIARVADRFEEFLIEVKNNRLDEAENEIAPSQKIEARFDLGIIQPIRELDMELISLATRNVDNCRRVANLSEELLPAVDATALIHQQILSEMKKILSAMSDSENFQEIINDLLEIKGGAKKVGDGIEEKLKPKDVFEDKDIFDE